MYDGRTEHAVVVGAGMAGLLAARTLADRFAHVTLLERDPPPTAPVAAQPRRGVPQGKHVHALLAGGRRALDEIFPGLSAELVGDGAPEGDMLGDYRLGFGGHWMRRGTSGLRALSVSRPHLESTVRKRVLATAEVGMRSGCDVVGVVADGRDRVTGVRLVDRSPGSAAEVLDADMVVDASGRGSRLPAWLEGLGHRPPAAQRVPVGIGYSSCRYRLAPDALDGDIGLVWGPTPGLPRAAGFARIETGEWLFTAIGVGGDHPPRDHDGLLEFAAGLPCPVLPDVLRRAEPTTGVATFRFPAAVRRRYDRVPGLPVGLVAVGDGVCSLDPIYGQGMAVAAMQAVGMRDDLRAGRSTRRMQARAVAASRTAWDLAKGADLALPCVPGRRGLAQRAAARYVRGLQAAASRDAGVATGFLRVVGLVDPPSRLLRPRVVARAVRLRATGPGGSGLRAMTVGLVASALAVPAGSLSATVLMIVVAMRRRRRG